MNYYTLPSSKELNTLEACVIIEECCAKIYRHFATQFKNNSEVAAIWNELAQDEDTHADKFRKAVQTYGSSPECLNDDNYLIEAMIDKLNDMIVSIKSNPPKLKEAFLTAAILEHSLEKYHVETGKLLVNGELAQLLSSMAHNDQFHKQMLDNMA